MFKERERERKREGGRKEGKEGRKERLMRDGWVLGSFFIL